jgi:hypothetical protein
VIDLPPPTYEQTIEAIARCDIPTANIRITYEDYLQSDEVTISDLGELTDEKLQCLKAAVHPFYILTLQDEAQRAAFYKFSKREDRPKQRAEAREWLRSKDLLDRLPTFDPKQGIQDFSVALELACGLEPGSALMVREAASLAVRPDFVLGNKFKKSADALYCLTQMFAASDASEHGFDLFFIGNAAYVEEDKK